MYSRLNKTIFVLLCSAFVSFSSVFADDLGSIVTCFGTGGVGQNGTTPSITLSSPTFAAGDDLNILVENGTISSLSFLYGGFQETAIPFLGNTLYVAPNFLFTKTRTFTSGAPGSATASINLTIPDVNPGTLLVFQWLSRTGNGSGIATSAACKFNVQGVGTALNSSDTSAIGNRSKALRALAKELRG